MPHRVNDMHAGEEAPSTSSDTDLEGGRDIPAATPSPKRMSNGHMMASLPPAGLAASSLALSPRPQETAANPLGPPRSPLFPENIIPEEHRSKIHWAADVSSTHEHHSPMQRGPGEDAAAVDLANGVMLIYPKKINNFRRFRMLFMGLLCFISASTQGVHSVFGTLFLQVLFNFDVRKMVIVYLCGQSFGMFVFPFGMLYDWFGPRIVVALGSVITALGQLLLALTFGGHIENTVTNCAVFYTLMCWGCYALNVAVLPAVLTHMPRDRGQPTGLLETFSGLGSSFFSCLFRGFFKNNFEHLMWFLFAVTVTVGAVGTWYLENAPYVVTRWEKRHITPRELLRKYLIRNRYMSQLVPQRRYRFMTLILILLNFFLTIQAVVVSYLASEITPGKLRGIAIGAICIVVLTLILVIPVEAIDGPTEQDVQVIEAAKEKEERLLQMQEERYRQRHLERRAAAAARAQAQADAVAATGGETAKASNAARDSAEKKEINGEKGTELRLNDSAAQQFDAVHRSAHESTSSDSASSDGNGTGRASPVEVPMLPLSARSNRSSSRTGRRSDGGQLSHSRGLPPYAAAGSEWPLLSLYLHDDGGSSEGDGGGRRGRRRSEPDAEPPLLAINASTQWVGSGAFSVFDAMPVAAEGSARDASRSGSAEAPVPARREQSLVVRVDTNDLHSSLRGSLVRSANTPYGGSQQFEFTRAPPSTYDNPRVETITLCGEVYVTPVYETSFWESLTYLDLWMIAYTTMCTWGVGATMAGNYNIYVMLLARYGAMEQKHYILFAAMAGVSTAGGRVFLGIYERLLRVMRERLGVVVVPTFLYPMTSVGLLLGVVLWLALPGDKVLVLAYLIAPAFYGMSTSVTPYVLGTIFDRDLGMHYGFCFFAGAVGFVLCYWCSWYLTYRRETSLTPRGYYCVGERRCMDKAVGIYLALVFSSIASSYIVHRRYSKLTRGKLGQRRVIVPRVKKVFETCGCASRNDSKEKKNIDEAEVTVL